ncbi:MULTISPECIES: bifunctional helix-turn-helix transcriptional regulator/GNAT family N-acetyltransferase [unclassified Erythrobacter]|uniref:bifunctional helix-turn-helix transcriptional regulator/GNAT family N-acetyltransferase n=1 Tax=unclassified Erythrobacter TaxID=2633097 RepID=UPI00076D3511|nr:MULTISPECIES: bifunctional helix-turn-helix transcriptional regulator/GNAT family N-acetyltransferase [unclassified Erythrobacter]KWV96242.1 MarR family transcriptional regulator [Erythrobacter sp. AP23]MBO6526296.1 MarR family transcriptional regulator/GNAT family N-acetyltransferase [Erythrobacter sp.]MBO6530549.1 MarR family transcriptional regulator/GNAT family N-acetyltransferase [Erythrobacter sp.]
MVDVVAQMGPAFLGSRLKRLGERMQAGAASVLTDAGIPLQPGHMAAMAALRTGPKTVGQLAEASGTSQPGMTRTIGHLKKLGLATDEACADQRSRMISLTEQGERMAQTIASDVWPKVGAAAEQILARVDGDFLRQLAIIEEALAEASIAERAARTVPQPLSLREYDRSLAHEFFDINREWIEDMFAMEEADREILEHPQERIIDAGGDILFVEAAGLGIVGTCALLKTGPGAFELTKMGVRESARGLKAGEFLLAATIERARELGAETLYLLTNSKCAPAIHLYEKLGFEHDRAVMERYAARYDRCDVAMLYTG